MKRKNIANLARLNRLMDEAKLDALVGDEAEAGALAGLIGLLAVVGIFDIMTADGLFAGQIFRDIRDPKALPWSGTNVTRGMRLDDITPGQEHFQGYFTRTADNKYYAVAGHNHASVVEASRTRLIFCLH